VRKILDTTIVSAATSFIADFDVNSKCRCFALNFATFDDWTLVVRRSETDCPKTARKKENDPNKPHGKSRKDFKREETPSMLKVGVVSTYTPLSRGYGGIPGSVAAYLDALSLLDVDVTYYGPDCSLGGRVSLNQLRNRFPKIQFRIYSPLILKKWGVGVGFLRFLVELAKSDIIFIHGTRTMPTVLAGFAARLGRTKYFVVAHAGLDADRVARTNRKRRLLFPMMERMVLWSVRNADAIIVSGDIEKSQLLHAVVNIRVVIIENFFKFNVERLDALDHSKGWRYIFVGRIDSDKGILAFCQAWSDVASRSSRLEIVGSEIVGSGAGAYASALKDLMRSDGRISLIGELAGEEVFNRIKNSHVLVLPTGMDDPVTENFGNVVVEAFLCSKPVMVTKGLHWDAYPNYSSILRFEPTSEGAKKSVCSFESITSSQYAKMCESAHELSKNFCLQRGVDQLRELIGHV
jgi:glycosyltransferase involved in cell wall biosynthesis